MKLCPCGTGIRYLNCCGNFLVNKANADTPLALMRSRYTAFVEENANYLKKTMEMPALAYFEKDIFKKRNVTVWLGLEIINFQMDPNDVNKGFVEFIATYSSDGQIKKIHEISEFHRIANKWYYVNGVFK